METLTSIKKLHLFLSFIYYNYKFIQDYHIKVVPLTRLTAKNIV